MKRKFWLFAALTATLGLSACHQTPPPVPAATTTAETTATEAPEAPAADTVVTIDLAQTGKEIHNKLSDINMWMFQRSWLDTPLGFPSDFFAKTMPFVRRVQFMQATGGNKERDLFLEPENFNVLDDYNFEPLIKACENALNQGIKPMIKTGNVPLKFSSTNTRGTFDVNLFPPDDYDEYYNYMYAMTTALVERFGLEEVKSWRFGVFTEYENADWFDAGDKQSTFEAYCKIYDYTAAAIEAVLGKGIDIGAHSMSVIEGLWDEEDFIRHCAEGINYYTGEKGSPLTYLAVSFYDENPNDKYKALRDMPGTVEKVRSAAVSAGLTDLEYGIDEGRILSGKKGAERADLMSRIVGQTYQAAYDARLLLQMVEHDIDYFASWGYSTAPLWGGVPSVSLHTANEFYKLVGTTRVHAETIVNTRLKRAENDALATISENGTAHIMAYNFGTFLGYDEARSFAFNLSGLKHNGNPAQKAKLTITVIDDDANFFDEWMADCEANGITAEDFHWSPDSAQISGNLRTDKARALFEANMEKYMQAAELTSKTEEVSVENGALTLNITLPAHAVVFYTIEPIS
jgi:hypothetical protein